MIKRIAWGVVVITIAALFQSTVFSRLFFHIHAIPDIALVILVYSAYVNGIMTGQLTGFFSGFLLDFLSSSPLGFNALIRTLVGALTGFLRGTFFLDLILLPMALCAGATVFKAALYFLLHVLLSGAVPVYSLTGFTFWIELGLNTLAAPFIFGFLKLFATLLVGRKENT